MRGLPAAITLLAGITLAGAVFAMMQKEEDEHQVLKFTRIAESAAAAIEARINRDLNVLRALAALHSVSGEVGQEDFAILVRPFLMRNPSIQALVWAPRVSQEEREPFEARMRKVWPDFHITEQVQPDQLVHAGARAAYYPILFVEPVKDNGLTRGLDIARGPLYEEAVRRARDTGEIATSDPIRHHIGDITDPFIMALHPVYSMSVPTETTVRRRENLRGIVAGRIRIAGVLEQSMVDLRLTGIDLFLYELLDGGSEQLLYSRPASLREQRGEYSAPPEKGLLFSRVLGAADRNWRLVLTPVPGVYAVEASRVPWVALAACLLFTLLATANVSAITMRYARTRRVARRLETELTHVSRLMTLGELAPALAHEVNQPLAVIGNYTRACLGRLKQAGSPSDLSDMLQEIGKQVDRAAQIVEHIRNLARREAPGRVEVNLNAAIREMLQLLHTEMVRREVRVELLLDEAVPPVQANRVQVEQVMLNLVRNASEAMSANTNQERVLTIRTRRLQARADMVEVMICDTGPGVPERMRPRLFESFYTTKPGGMGMGLSISRSIIQAHGGAIWMKPAARRGTCFHFTLPAPVPAKTEGQG